MNRIYMTSLARGARPGLSTGEDLVLTNHGLLMPEDLINGQYGHQYAAHVIIHEMAHGATVKAMVANPDLKASLLEASARDVGMVTKAMIPLPLRTPGLSTPFTIPMALNTLPRLILILTSKGVLRIFQSLRTWRRTRSPRGEQYPGKVPAN